MKDLGVTICWGEEEVTHSLTPPFVTSLWLLSPAPEYKTQRAPFFTKNQPALLQGENNSKKFPARGSRCVFSSDPAVSSSIFVGAEKVENLNSKMHTSEGNPKTWHTRKLVNASFTMNGTTCQNSQFATGTMKALLSRSNCTDTLFVNNSLQSPPLCQEGQVCSSSSSRQWEVQWEESRCGLFGW